MRVNLGHCYGSQIAMIFVLLGGQASYAQTASDGAADTSAAQAQIQAIQESSQASLQPQQAFPGLKAASCKEAIPYVESPSGLLGDWDRTMKRYMEDSKSLAMIEDTKKTLLSDASWRTGTAATLAADVHTFCRLTEDVLAAMVPGGNTLKLAINVSEDFGVEVSRRAVQVYENIEKGDDVLSVLKSDPDELVAWGAKEAAKQAGYGRAVAVVSVLEDVASHMKTANEMAESKAVVQQQLRSLDISINQYQYNMTLKRQQLVAVEALKDAVIAACNAGQPTQAPPELANGGDDYQPFQDSLVPTVPTGTPWWAAIPPIRVPTSTGTMRPGNTGLAPISSQNTCNGVVIKAGQKICR